MMSIQVSRNNLFLTFGESLDFIDSSVRFHHLEVAYIANELCSVLSLSHDQTQLIVMASLIHDIGVFTASERIRISDYDYEDVIEHAEIGYEMLKDNPEFNTIALLIRYHHTHFSNLPLSTPMVYFSNLIFIADRISVLLKANSYNPKKITKIIKADSVHKYAQEFVEAFLKKSEDESFWAHLKNKDYHDKVETALLPDVIFNNVSEIINYSIVFIQSIDLRSMYTASHSVGVSKVAREIGQIVGYDRDNLDLLEISGYFHDIGKLAVSRNIFDKQSPLNSSEFTRIKSHAQYTYDILSKINGLESVATIASAHHEKIDGSGYPLHRNDLSELEMILGIADMFTALTEKRPYRSTTDTAFAVSVLEKEAENGKIDPSLAQIVINHSSQLSALNLSVQQNINTYLTVLQAHIENIYPPRW